MHNNSNLKELLLHQHLIMSRFSAFYWLLGIVIITTTACNNDNFDEHVEIPDFDYPSSVQFSDALSSYEIFEGN